MLCLQPATRKTTVGVKFCSFTLVQVYRDCAKKHSGNGLPELCKTVRLSHNPATQPTVGERMVKTKSQFKQVNEKLQPCFFKNDKWCLLSVEKSPFPGRKMKEHFVLKTRIFLSKVPFHQSAPPGPLWDGWISPASNKGFQYKRRTSRQLSLRGR